MRRTAWPVLVAALLATGCDKQSQPAEQANVSAPTAAPVAGKIDRSHAGAAAPTLGFMGPDGKPMSLATFRGKPVLLNLWATWCGPCVKELPTLDKLATQRAGKLQVVALSQDTDPAKVAPFFAERHFATLKPYTDAKMAWVPAVADNLPTSILFDSNGHEVWRTVGDLDWTGPTATEALRAIS